VRAPRWLLLLAACGSTVREESLRTGIGVPGLEVGLPQECHVTFEGFWLVKLPAEPGQAHDRIVAVRAVCTKLGGLPIWLWDEGVYLCPICASRYAVSGLRLSGPAPASLWRLGISADGPAGEILVNPQRTFRKERGEWSRSGSFLAVRP